MKCHRINFRTQRKFGHLPIVVGTGPATKPVNEGRTVGYGFCKRCGTYLQGLTKIKPFGDKRNFRRSDPRYDQFQKYLREQA